MCKSILKIIGIFSILLIQIALGSSRDLLEVQRKIVETDKNILIGPVNERIALTFKENKGCVANDMKVDYKGNVIIVGYCEKEIPNDVKKGEVPTDLHKDYITVKFSPDGQKLWSKSFSSPKIYTDEIAYALAIDYYNNVYVTGTSYYVTGFGGGYDTGNDCITIKYDAFGNEIWNERYDGKQTSDDEYNQTDECKFIAIDHNFYRPENNNIYVAGTTFQGSEKKNILLINYDLHAREMYTRYAYYAGEFFRGTQSKGHDNVTGLKTFYDRVFLTGVSSQVNGGHNLVVLEFDSAKNALKVVNDYPWGLMHTVDTALDSYNHLYVSGTIYNKDLTGLDFMVQKQSLFENLDIPVIEKTYKGITQLA